MAKGDHIRERLVEFAARVMDLCDDLAKTPAGTHVSGQLMRCATSAAPNYAEARGAESKNDFVHKLGLVFKELNESGGRNLAAPTTLERVVEVQTRQFWWNR